jgi:uncharacterized membrane protein YhhN
VRPARGGGTVRDVDGDTGVVAVGSVAGVVCAANWWSRRPSATSDGARRLELVTKPLATISLAALAVVAATSGADGASIGALIAAIAAFALCLAGDVALLPQVDRFVAGLASFLAGHLAFVVMFVLLGLDRPALALPALVGVMVVALTAGRRIVTGASTTSRNLVLPVRAYLAIISSMAVVGWTTGRVAALVGCALFVASDAVLGWNRFVDPRGWMPVTVMVTYHGALGGLAVCLR